jgi:hypothetical protein
MLCSLLRNGNCRHGNATALQSLKELPMTMVGNNSRSNQAAGLNLIIMRETRSKQRIFVTAEQANEEERSHTCEERICTNDKTENHYFPVKAVNQRQLGMVKVSKEYFIMSDLKCFLYTFCPCNLQSLQT